MHNATRYFTQLLTAVSLCTVAATVVARDVDDSWKLSFGADYSSGDYGDPVETDILYLPLSGSYQYGPWTTTVTAAWLQIDGPGTVIGGGDGGVVVRGNAQSSSESGFGDIWGGLSYELQSFPPELGYLDLSAKVKLPTADEDKNLGTGEVDYTMQADYAYSMGRLTPLLTLAYKVKGDSGRLRLNDVWYLSAGADWRMSDLTHIGATIDFQESATDTDDALELFTYVSYTLSDDWKISPYVYIGFSDGSPDQGLGLQFIYRR